MNKKKIIFLDRDGTIIKDKRYMYRIEDLEFMDGAIDALKVLQKDYGLVIVTNQSGVGRGLFDKKDFERFHNHLLNLMDQEGIRITDTLVCFHRPEDGCRCRKPGTKLVENFLMKYPMELDRNGSFMIGDKKLDIKLAEALKINGLRLSSEGWPKLLKEIIR